MFNSINEVAETIEALAKEMKAPDGFVESFMNDVAQLLRELEIDALRYAEVRKLSPGDFSKIYFGSMQGEKLDTKIDEIIKLKYDENDTSNKNTT